MRIDCPSCAAGFEVNPSVLEPNGRTVRCASCKATWYVRAPSLVLAEAEAPLSESMPAPALAAEDRADHEALVNDAQDARKGALIDIAHSPSIAPGEESPAKPVRKTVHSFTSGPSKRRRGIPLGVVAAVLFAVLALGLTARHSVVRAAPELASLYAAIGLPVNLRGLEFQNIRTRQEIQDGITVLAIEGEVENVANRAVELPRVRLSVLGENGTEIYSWTALLPRSILYPHERVPFKSRLASPPAAGKEIMVRFLTRADLTASLR